MAKGKKSRLNMKLIGTAAAVAVVGIGGAVAALKLNRNRHPERYIAAGDEFAKQHDYPHAIESYSTAAQLLPTNSDIHLKLGRAYFQMKALGIQNFYSCIAELTKAEELSPDSKEAWGALLTAIEYELTQIEGAQTTTQVNQQLPAVIAVARDAAAHLVAIDPANLEATISESSLKIRTWLLKIAIPRTAKEQREPADKQLTDEQEVDQAIADLTKLMSQHPENEMIPYWIARAKINQAASLLDIAQNNPDAIPLFSEAAGEFDNSIAVAPKNINLYLRKAEILDLLERTDPFAASVPEYRRQMHQTLDSAQSLADISNPEEYQSAKAEWARYLRKTDPARAEEVYRDLITRFSALPQYQTRSLQYRIELASLLRQDVSRQADALALLDAIPSVPPSTLTTYEQQQSWAGWVCYAKLGRAQIETDQLSRNAIGKKRDDLIADANASLDAAASRLEGTIPLLQARGNLFLAQNKLRDAIQTLTLAVDKSTEQSGNVPYDLLRQLCKALTVGQQTGAAIDLLEAEIKKNPAIENNGEVQATLANLYLQNKDYANARKHVDWLRLRSPDDTGVIVLEMQALGPAASPDEMKRLFDKLPEQTPAQISSKLLVADGLLKSPEESNRLLKIEHAADPGALEPVRRLIISDLTAGDKANAQAVLDDLKKTDPTNPQIPVFQDAIADKSPEKIFDEQLRIINAIQDPLLRERRLADLYATIGNTPEELKHLLAAAALSPNDINVLQTIFMLYLGDQRFDDAEKMLPHLSELDADSAHGLMLKTRLALARKDFDTALITGRQLTKDDPEFSGSWELYGEALAAKGQDDAACQQFNSALQKQATNIDARNGLIQCSVAQGKFDDARRYISDARTRYPDDPAYQEMEVNFEIQYGNPEAIVPQVTQALKDHPDVRKNYVIAAAALQASSQRCAGRGDKDAANQFISRAKDVYQQAITKWPDNLQFSVGLADICMQQNDVAGAEAVLKTVSERPRWKTSPAPLVMLARAEMAEKKYDSADALLRRAMGEDANYLQARLELADCLVAEKQYDEALQILKPATTGFAVREKYVRLLLSLSRGSEAEDMVLDALKTDEKNPGLANLLIDVYENEHKVVQAMQEVNKAISQDPTNVGAYLRRGQLEGSGSSPDFDAAKKDLQFYSDAVPTDVRARIMLAEVMDKLQDSENAIRQLKAAISYSPLERQPRLMLLSEYLVSAPPRSSEAEELLTTTLALPAFQHDPVFEMQAAKLYGLKGDGDRAIVAAQDAMAHASDKASMLNQYLAILVLCKKYSLLLDESKSYVSDPQTSWVVFTYRGQAKALMGDKDGAAAEYDTALNRAGSEKGTRAAREVAKSIAVQLSTAKAVDMILPRAKNSATWGLVAIDVDIMAKNIPGALVQAESAMNSFDSLEAEDQAFLLDRTSSLYLQSVPPQPEKALAIFHKQFDRNPNDLNAMNNIASVLVDMVKPPQPQDALVWSQKAYDLCKQNNLVLPAIFDTHGWVLMQCGKVTEGISVLHEAIDRSDFPDAHYHLAEGYLRKGQPDDAKRELDAALKMLTDPHPQYLLIDQDLKSKIDVALKEADQKIQASAAGTPPG